MLPSRIVVRFAGNVREVFYNPKTGTQVAVLDWVPLRSTMTLHIPHDGKGGYRVVVHSWKAVNRITKMQCSRLGKLLCNVCLTLANARLKPLSQC